MKNNKLNISHFAAHYEASKAVSQKALRAYHQKMRNLLKNSGSDWNENSETSLKHIENRPFYSNGMIEEDKQYTIGGRYSDDCPIEIVETESEKQEAEYYMSADIGDRLFYYREQYPGFDEEHNPFLNKYWPMWDNLKINIFDKDFDLILREHDSNGGSAYWEYENTNKTVYLYGEYYERTLHTELYINLTKEGIDYGLES